METDDCTEKWSSGEILFVSVVGIVERLKWKSERFKHKLRVGAWLRSGKYP